MKDLFSDTNYVPCLPGSTGLFFWFFDIDFDTSGCYFPKRSLTLDNETEAYCGKDSDKPASLLSKQTSATLRVGGNTTRPKENTISYRS